MALDYLPSPGWAVIYGETPSATRWSELGDNDDALATGAGIDDLAILNRHYGAQSITTDKMGIMASTYVRRTTDQSVPNATFTAISWNTEDNDTLGAWAAGSPTRITIPSNGLYLMMCNVKFNGGSGGERQLRFYLNSTKYISTQVIPIAGNPQGLVIATLRRFTAADYVEAMVYTSSGAGVTINGGIEPETNYMGVIKLGA